ncbi:MAG: ComEC/Rec2 family competence protein [Patescibacteria group bacterium]
MIFSRNLKNFEGHKIRISAKVLQEPSKFASTQKFYLEGFNFYLPKYPQVGYGDRVTVEGTVEDGKVINAELVSLEKDENVFLGFRKKIISLYKKSLPEPHSSLVAGIILGYKSEQTGIFWSQLRKTGTMHVVIASGMNVSFVAGFLMSILLMFMPRKKAVLATLVGIWIYSFISGFEAPVVRSTIMFSIALVAQLFGRLSFSMNALFLSALLMLSIKPAWIYDLGFILSFTATASLMLFTKKVEKFLKWVPKYIKTDLTTTLAAQIGVTPILFVTFGGFNLLSPLVNTLILWTVPLIMIIGSVGGIVGLIVPVLGRLILYLTYPLTWYFVSIVGIFS